jgi:hypothetical protein
MDPTVTTLTFGTGASPAAVSGLPATLIATVVGPSGAPAPTGAVTFTDGGTTIGTASLDGSGTATLTVAISGAGMHAIEASYGGDLNFLTSGTSASLVVLRHFKFAVDPPLSATASNKFKSGQTIPFQVRVLDFDTGADVSASIASTYTVTLLAMEKNSANPGWTNDLPETYTGEGDPGGVFAWNSPAFQYTLKTTNYPAGTINNSYYYDFNVTVTNNGYPTVLLGVIDILGESK